MKPYTQKRKGNEIIREFSNQVNSMELVWHRDAKDRVIEILEGEGWKFQLDNELPVELKKGDKVITKSGMHGKIVELSDKDSSCVLETMAGKIKFDRSAISMEMSAKLNAPAAADKK